MDVEMINVEDDFSFSMRMQMLNSKRRSPRLSLSHTNELTSDRFAIGLWATTR